jgi:hypothetical protein
VKLTSAAFLFITHHVLSRAAQRAEARTAEDLLLASEHIASTAMHFSNKISLPRALSAPPEGWRVPLISNEDFTVVLVRHEKREALVAATLLHKRRSAA